MSSNLNDSEADNSAYSKALTSAEHGKDLLMGGMGKSELGQDLLKRAASIEVEEAEYEMQTMPDDMIKLSLFMSVN